MAGKQRFAAAVSASPAASPAAAVSDWLEYVHEESGKPYYFNAKTNVTQWDVSRLRAGVRGDGFCVD
jgi:hypothetical protein